MHMNNRSSGECRKRKRGDRVFRFKSFCDPGHPVDFHSSFQQNIRMLLEFGHIDTNLSRGMKLWSFQLELYRNPPMHTLFFVIEEPIEKSIHRHCQHCRCVGWGHHMICNRRFHFILPSKETKQVTACSNYEGGCNGSEVMAAKQDLVELKGHLMHGVMHSNGFGHLLYVNGVEMGSEFLPGWQIMDFWDRICSRLGARKVSLIDIAKKRSMDLRLIHGVAYGEPWFGCWGYKFGLGSYGVTQQMHLKAIEALRGMPLGLLVNHFGNSNHEIPTIVARYQSMSSHSLQTLGHLIRFMLEIRTHLPSEALTTTNNHGIVIETACRWSSKRVEMATQVIVEALKKSEFKWVSRQEVRDTARAYIGDTGLLDFVLKSLGNHIVGNYMVRRIVNPVTKVLEYCLEDITNSFPNHEGLLPNDTKTKVCFHVSKGQLMKDMYYLYKYLLKEQRPTINTGIFTVIPAAVRMILDTKHLIKDYEGEFSRKIKVRDEENLKLLCTVCLRNEQEGEEGRALPPYELVTMPSHATIRDLKREVERIFKEIYWGMRSFVAESIVEVNGRDLDLVNGLIESGSNLVIKGRIVGRIMDSEEIYEIGDSNWIIDCPCGAKDDDGEPLISCDICEVRQHMRCVRLSEDVPHIFLCTQCEHNIAVFPSLP
ncbi:RING/FYVE/PHD zinc finger superfamily protein [Tasmannia lanceolata]|uniref:RING/FYVE/PHD zinc finger superfamily protein n=1 Tax=Tasmannia lanceolata TaxID=3420 RepID=UPI004063D4EE